MKPTKKTSKQKKNTRMILFAVIAVIVIVLIIRSRKPESLKTSEKPSGSPVSKSLPSLGPNATLKSGTKAQEVKYVQDYYNTQVASPLGKTKLVVDGIFGPKTQAAVKSITGTTSTTWNAFKQRVDGTSNNSTASIYTTDWNSGENVWGNTNNNWEWQTPA